MNRPWTSEQERVIDRGVGSTVVIAAPGSGKTSVLTEHIATVVRRDGVSPNKLMAVTFTRQAAEHMRSKLRKHPTLSFKVVESLRIGTFHAQMFRALLEAHADVPVVLNEREQRLFMRQAMENTGLSRHSPTHRAVTEYLTTYSRLVGSQVPPRTRREHQIYLKYQSLKRKKNRWDYDDILLATVATLDKGNRLPYFHDLEYLLVDEFQDTNSLQWAFVETLHKAMGIPIFVVGDDDQSVYGFRGASPAYLQLAPSRLSRAQTHMLTYNFRSDGRVVSHAEALIQQVEQRVEKPLNPVSRKPGMVRAYVVDHEVAQATCIREIVLDLKGHIQGHASEEKESITIGILARTRRQLYPIWGAVAPILKSLQQSSLRPLSIELRTYHDSKGREWDVVVMVDMIELPHGNRFGMTARQSLDEERRLFYVAMTRAKHVLIGFVPQSIDGQLVRHSRFLEDARIKPSSWSEGELQIIREVLRPDQSFHVDT